VDFSQVSSPTLPSPVMLGPNLSSLSMLLMWMPIVK
jgi:hypothetical protein